MSSIFKIPEGENLVTYYLLPLVGVNRVTFGRHFKNSYVDKDGTRVFVELNSNMTSPVYKNSPCFITEFVVDTIRFVQFNVPGRYLSDTACFVIGKYSEMSRPAKNIIFKTSSLPFNSKMGNFNVSHPVLQALDRTKTLRTFLQNITGEEIPDDTELMRPPDEDWFIEERLKSQKFKQ